MCWCQNRIHLHPSSINRSEICLLPAQRTSEPRLSNVSKKMLSSSLLLNLLTSREKLLQPMFIKSVWRWPGTSASRSPYTFLEYACIEHETTGEATLKRFSVMDSESRVTGNSKNIPIKGHNPEDDHDDTIDNSIEPPRKFFRDIPRIPYDGNCLRLVRPLSD